MMKIEEVQLRELRNQVIDTARKTGQFILQEAKTFTVGDIEKKGMNDLVSYVDREAEKIITSALIDFLPQSGFVAEEGTGAPLKNGYNWLVDPLDGTTNFIHGLPIFAVSIALLDPNDKVVLGVVYEPNRDECFHAITGEQAYCNDKLISVSSIETLEEGLLATGFPYYDFEKMPEYTEVLKAFMQKSHGLRRMGSAAIDLVYVAIGRFEGFFEYNLNPWDVAAGAFIVQQSGGTVTDFQNGNDYIFGKEILAANKGVHVQMQTTIAQLFNKK